MVYIAIDKRHGIGETDAKPSNHVSYRLPPLMSKLNRDAAQEALKHFAEAVTEKSTSLVSGQPEDQLRGPFEELLRAVGDVLSRDLVCTGEARLADRMGRPDYAIQAADLLVGYVELKAPGEGADTKRFRGRNKEQANRFYVIPNLLYTDGNEWQVYRSGEPVGPLVRLARDVASDGRAAIGPEDAEALLDLITRFLSWSPEIPCTR